MRDAVEHRLLLFGGGKQRVLPIRKDRAEQRRSEQQAGNQLTHDRRLLEPQHDFAEQAADEDQHHKLGDENQFGGALRGFIGGKRRPRRQRERQQRAEPS